MWKNWIRLKLPKSTTILHNNIIICKINNYINKVSIQTNVTDHMDHDVKIINKITNYYDGNNKVYKLEVSIFKALTT